MQILAEQDLVLHKVVLPEMAVLVTHIHTLHLVMPEAVVVVERVVCFQQDNLEEDVADLDKL
jgi:hypothetical protein